jgi:hypothetical protein
MVFRPTTSTSGPLQRRRVPHCISRRRDGGPEQARRYCAVLFPFVFLRATTRPFILRKGLLVISAALYMLCLVLFTNLHPIF